jgi:hypothetical protein
MSLSLSDADSAPVALPGFLFLEVTLVGTLIFGDLRHHAGRIAEETAAAHRPRRRACR